MFEKYLSLLPYNPGLIHQMGFYGRRMREEAAIRRTGMIFIVLAFLVQFFAVIAPPLSSSAASGPSNDLINGGFNSAAQAAADCNNNTQSYQTILATYDISCKEVANAPTETIKSTDDNRQLYSMGRFPYNNAGETTVYINNGGQPTPYYVRYLWSWDTAGASSYKALRIIAANGTTYWLLYGCGNLTSVGLPKQYSPPPLPTPVLPPVTVAPPVTTSPHLGLVKSTSQGYPTANSSVVPGATLGYRIDISNTGDGEADNVDLLDSTPANTSFVWQSQNAGATVHSFDASTNAAHWSWSSISKNNVGNYTVNLTVKVNANAPNGSKICNVAKISATGVGTITSNQVCMTVSVPATPPSCPYNSALPLSSPACAAPCPYNGALPASSPQCVDTPPAPAPTPTPTPAPTPTPTCLYDTSLPVTSPDCKPCQSSTTTTDILSCVAVSKAAANLTENVADANNTTAQPGDSILYTLTAKNDSNADLSQYNFQESLGDVLIYADPTDLHGGTLDSSTGIVSWPSIDLPAGGTASEQVTVQVKNPIPSQPASADPANPGAYDLTMTNVYGNTINIHVPAPPTQSIVAASTALPNTGPGTGLFIFAAIMVFGSYFFSRSRLLAHETAMAVKSASVG
jgi:uncharacterized repeat protein (TIGR01451 family)